MNLKSKDRYGEIASLIPPLLPCAALIALNVFLGAAPAAVAVSVAGSFYYVLFGLTAYCDDSRRLDPIQSGRTAALTLLVVFAAVFTGGHPVPTIVLVLAGAVAMEFYTHRLLRATGSEMAAYGAFINITMALVFFIYWTKDPLFGVHRLNGILPAVIPGRSPHPAAGAAMLVSGAALLVLMILSLPELACLSLGERYFSRSGRSHRFWYAIVLALRGLFMAMTFLLLGWMHGAVLTLTAGPGKSRSTAVLKTLLLCVSYTQGLMLLSRRLNPLQIVIFSLAVSTTLLILRYKGTGTRYAYR